MNSDITMKSISAILCFLSFAAIGQTNFKPPVLFPPSPDVANMEKYGTYPVSYSTGLPQISIPLYTIKQNDLEVPITLDYHASGIKITQDAGWIGLGWSLNAGGQISRQVMGNKPDETPTVGYLVRGAPLPSDPIVDPNTVAGIDYLDQLYRGNYDTEPDIFSYSFPGKSGKFFFDQNNQFKPRVIPYDPIQINFNGTFNVLDERGIAYDFQTIEQTQNNSSPTVTSAWMLNKITSANKKDVIEFFYTSRYGVTYHDETQYIVVTDLISEQGGASGVAPPVNTASHVQATEYKPDIIKFKDGRVKFQIADRLDGFATPVPQKRLTTITVESYNSLTDQYVVVKTISLIQTYFIKNNDQTSLRLRLDEVHINDTDNNVVQTYRFDYNTLVQLPSTSSKARDYWGYYNGADFNSGLIPTPMQISFQASTASSASTLNIGNGVREPNPNYSQANILKRIYFPTQGYTDFEYEPNRYLEGTKVKVGGGVRIKRIKSFNGTDQTPILKTYKYGDAESGYGQKNFFLAYSYYSTLVNERILDTHVNLCLMEIGRRRVRTFFSVPPISVEPYDGSTVFYPTVTEYVGNDLVNTGKTIYKFTNVTDNLQSDQAAGGQPAIFTNHFRRGLLKEKQVFRNNNGVFRLVSKTVNNYEAFTDVIYSAVGYKVKKNLISFHVSGGEDLKLGPLDPNNACGLNDTYSWIEGNYAIHSGDNKLIGTAEYVYDNLDESKYLLTTTSYTYGDFFHQQVTEVSTTQSNGSTRSTLNRYPSDFAALVPYSSMIANTKNMIGLPVEQEQQLNATKLSLEKTEWKDFGNDIIQPEKVFTQIQTTPLQQEIVYAYDDQGRIKEYTTRDGLTTSIIWGFSRKTPLAQVINARSTQVAFTSFEDSGKGNWEYTGSPVVSASAKTGNYVYNGSLSKTGLDSGVPSMLQCWVQGSNTLIVTTPAGTITGELLETLNGWSLYGYNLGGTLSVNISNPISISIDDVRLYPQASQLRSYTMKPLVGVEALSDVNNNSSKFKYDPFGRLKGIIDRNNELTKSFVYAYKSTTDYVAPFVYEYFNNEVTYTYQKQCPVGYRGNLVGYTIPAGNYTSEQSIIDANMMAFYEAEANGPLKAEQEGICTEIIYVNVVATNARGDSGYKIRFEPLSGQPSLPLFDLNAGIDTQTTITVEAGTYKISIFRQTEPYPLRTFDIFGTNYPNVISATKDNVSVSPTSNNTIRLWSNP